MKILQKSVYLAKLSDPNSKIKKVRPVLVIQNNLLNKALPTTIILPFSSIQFPKSQRPKTVPVVQKDFLDKDSYVLIHAPITIAKNSLITRIGFLSDNEYYSIIGEFIDLVN